MAWYELGISLRQSYGHLRWKSSFGALLPSIRREVYMILRSQEECHVQGDDQATPN